MTNQIKEIMPDLMTGPRSYFTDIDPLVPVISDNDKGVGPKAPIKTGKG